MQASLRDSTLCESDKTTGNALLFHQRRRAGAAMLTDAALRVLLERFVGLGRRLRLFAAVPARGLLSFFAFLTLRATFFL